MLTCFDCLFRIHEEGADFCIEGGFRLISDEFGEIHSCDICEKFKHSEEVIL
jgi:hypothetical protein